MQEITESNSELADQKSFIEQQPVHTSSHEIVATFAYWIIRQGSNILPEAYPKLMPALRQFERYIMAWSKEHPNRSEIAGCEYIETTIQELREIISEDMLGKLGHVFEWNEPSQKEFGDFIDLAALARNIVNMIEWDNNNGNTG